MKQRTPEWFAARLGHATASRFSDVIAKIKTGEAASRRNYRAQLVCERLTGVPTETYQNAAMQWGTDHEDEARMAYEARNGVLVEEVGFIRHPDLMAGCSPDGVVDRERVIEIKCPNTATHIDTLLGGMPPEHIPQIHGGLWITGRKDCDFISYDPRLPEKLQLYVQTVVRDQKYIDALEAEVRKFLAEVDATLQALEVKCRI